ncbi:MAG: NADPH-dependent F420 reductase [Novosphingobium sp.]|nr:NADPH-dependent F420 reductase [Novosphingobium sp.]
MAAIGVIGGTGQLGKAIARRLARAGHVVTIGSRSPESAVRAAADIAAAGGDSYAGAAAGKDVVIVTVPYAAQADALDQIRDHVGSAIVVDTTVPLVPPKVMRVQLPPAGSAALEARARLAQGTRLVSAFHDVAAHKLITEEAVDCDVLVFSDDVEARGVVIALAGDMGLRGLAGGALVNSVAAEALTSILIFMNKTYAADGAGIRFTGLTKAPPIP